MEVDSKEASWCSPRRKRWSENNKKSSGGGNGGGDEDRSLGGGGGGRGNEDEIDEMEDRPGPAGLSRKVRIALLLCCLCRSVCVSSPARPVSYMGAGNARVSMCLRRFGVVLATTHTRVIMWLSGCCVCRRRACQTSR